MEAGSNTRRVQPAGRAGAKLRVRQPGRVSSSLLLARRKVNLFRAVLARSRLHLSQIERLVRVGEAGELAGAAVEVDVAGAEGRQEAQPVVHCGAQGRSRQRPKTHISGHQNTASPASPGAAGALRGLPAAPGCSSHGTALGRAAALGFWAPQADEKLKPFLWSCSELPSTTPDPDSSAHNTPPHRKTIGDVPKPPRGGHWSPSQRGRFPPSRCSQLWPTLWP